MKGLDDLTLSEHVICGVLICVVAFSLIATGAIWADSVHVAKIMQLQNKLDECREDAAKSYFNR